MKTLVLLPALLVAFATGVNPIVQIRDVPNAPDIAIVAWEAGEPQFGLRTRLRRDGSHLGAGRAGEHRLFMSSVFVETSGGFARATAHTGKLLRDAGGARDIDACRFGNVCSPSQTIGLGLSDEFLREHRDSIVITLRPKTGRRWSIRLERSLIDAYLAAVDSVAASLKKGP